MNIIARGKALLEQLRALAQRGIWEWKRCPHCGSTWAIKNGGYVRHPRGLGGREEVRVERHLSHECGKTYTEASPLLVRGSWYYRSVHRAAVDHWQHLLTGERWANT